MLCIYIFLTIYVIVYVRTDMSVLIYTPMKALLDGSLHIICAIVMLVKQELTNSGKPDYDEERALFRVGCGVTVKPEIYAKRFYPFKCSVSLS